MSDAPLYVALGATLLINGPQLARTVRTRDVTGFATHTILLRILSNGAWLVYAVLEANVLLGLPSALNLVAEALLLALVVRYRRTPAAPTTDTAC